MWLFSILLDFVRMLDICLFVVVSVVVVFRVWKCDIVFIWVLKLVG